VIGTCSASNGKYVRELGADEVISYRSEDVFQRAKAIAGDRAIDAIIDNIGPSNGVDNLGLLGPEGGLACIAGIPDLSVVPDLPFPSQFTISVWEEFWSRRPFGGGKKIWLEWRQS
jgi:NADPH:quinone reductase-like Zn-dependent oxidoreductase